MLSDIKNGSDRTSIDIGEYFESIEVPRLLDLPINERPTAENVNKSAATAVKLADSTNGGIPMTNEPPAPCLLLAVLS